MQFTARDFWKMVHDRKCGVIVMLCQLTEAEKVRETSHIYDCVPLSLQEVCYQYWPSSGTQTYVEFTVEILREEKFEGFFLRSFGVFDGKVSPSHPVSRDYIYFLLE